MKKTMLTILLFCVLIIGTTGCASKQDYLDEVEKFQSALIEEGYVLQSSDYYKGIGYECSADSPYAKVYNSGDISFYYCISSEKERPQKYTSIDPNNMEARFWSNKYIFDLAKSENEESDSYMLDYYTISLNLTYNAIEDKVEGTYQETRNGANDVTTYEIEYNYNGSGYSCKYSSVSYMNIQDYNSCGSNYDKIFKDLSTNLRSEFNSIIRNHNIDSQKILDYIKK